MHLRKYLQRIINKVLLTTLTPCFLLAAVVYFVTTGN